MKGGNVARLVLALFASSCSSLFGYPSAEPELGASRCGDGVDNDFDGTIDCADPDCDGHCPEDSKGACADGRDNDGDGLTDGWDARCWPHAGPEASRCASSEPTDFEERFDAELSSHRWVPFGISYSAVVERPSERPARSDNVLVFPGSIQGSDPSGVVSTAAFDGAWDSFAVSFGVMVEAGALVRVALVPDALMAETGPPPELDSLAPLSVVVDATSTPTVTVRAGGATQGSGSIGLGAWHTVRVASSESSLTLAIDDTVVASGQRTHPSSSRLLVSADPQSAGRAQLDDLHLEIAGLRPCDVACPQIPYGDTCRLEGTSLTENVGYSVSVAKALDDKFCAIVGAGDLAQETASRAQSWQSTTGAEWRRAGTLPVPTDATELVGAGAAWDAASGFWLAALAWRDASAVRVKLSRSEDCATWTPNRAVADLPLDAGATSILVPGVRAPCEIYYTRPRPGAGPELWRLSSDDQKTFAHDDVPLATFDDDTILSPVSLVRAGPRDVVLTHRISPSTGRLGLGLWIADDGLGAWTRAATWPLIESDAARGGFDAAGIVSGALGWNGTQPFLLYGAKGRSVSELHAPGSSATLTVGSARLVASGVSPSEQVRRTAGACGDAICGTEESCDACAIDCGVCDGALIVADRFESPGAWSGGAAGVVYVSESSQRVNLSPGRVGWLQRTLPAPVFGDVELTFDVHQVSPSAELRASRCIAYVGLVGTGTDTGREPAAVLAQLDRSLACTAGAPAFSLLAGARGEHAASLTIGGSRFGAEGRCQGMLPGIPEAWHRVTLRRRSGRVTLAIAERDTCGDLGAGEAAIDYAGPMDGFDHLVIGWGGAVGALGIPAICDSSSAGVSIDNIVVRTLPCPTGGTLCEDPVSHRSSCVDLSASPEHCGGCFQPVGAAERCTAGKPVCAGTLCPDEEGSDSCVDVRSDPANCGACGVAVSPREACGNGYPRATQVRLPDGFAIDATEVTRGQYDAWLKTTPPLSLQPAPCDENLTFAPRCFWPPDTALQAADCVNWCDAYAYCAGVGKRLCGAIGGGAVPWGADATASQWSVACSAGGKNTYPYGDDYEAQSCNGVDYKLGGSSSKCSFGTDVAALATCQSHTEGYEGVYDMSGNALEWIDSCSAEQSLDDPCAIVGGNVCEPAPRLTCESVLRYARRAVGTSWGFRCCSL